MFSTAIISPFQAITAESRKLTNMTAALRRICTPKAGSGRLEVSAEVYKQWQQGGAPRKALLNMLIKSGGDKDTMLVQKNVSGIPRCVQLLFDLRFV